MYVLYSFSQFWSCKNSNNKVISRSRPLPRSRNFCLFQYGLGNHGLKIEVAKYIYRISTELLNNFKGNMVKYKIKSNEPRLGQNSRWSYSDTKWILYSNSYQLCVRSRIYKAHLEHLIIIVLMNYTTLWVSRFVETLDEHVEQHYMSKTYAWFLLTLYIFQYFIFWLLLPSIGYN